MSRFEQIQYPEKDTELHHLYQDIISNGFGKKAPLNWFTSQSERPDLLAGSWDLSKGIILNGQVPSTVKQMIAVKISLENECEYCSVVYIRALRSMGIPPEVIDCVTTDFSLSKVPPSQRAILQFALKASKHQQGLTDEDYQSLRDFGMGDGEIIEILLMVAITNFINTWADLSGIRPDKEEN